MCVCVSCGCVCVCVLKVMRKTVTEMLQCIYNVISKVSLLSLILYTLSSCFLHYSVLQAYIRCGCFINLHLCYI